MKPLATILGTGPKNPLLAARIVASVALALDGLHRGGRVHGDISPATILVDPETGDAALSARDRPSRPERRGLRDLVRDASLAYAAPERVRRAEHRSFDGRADLYALGVVFYEMLTGARPFDAGDALALAHAHLARAPVPAYEVEPEVPRVLSSIAQKLLAKAPSDRYQTGRGLMHDLERFLREGPDAPPFPLGAGDVPDDRRIWGRALGRDAEARAIEEAAARVSAGAVELVLVVGSPGVGKSTLVAEAREQILHRGGLFAAARPNDIAAPLAPLASLLTALARRALAEPEEHLASMRARLARSLGPDGGVLASLSPELALLLPDIPSAPEHRRLERAAAGFLRAFCEERPLVALFVDDIDRVDPATLSVLGKILEGGSLSRLLVLGAAREEETDPSRPLGSFVEKIAARGVAISRVWLGPLGVEHVGHLVADVLAAAEPDVAVLSSLLHRKSRGNPFLVLQMLEAFLADGVVERDPSSGAVRWDERRILEASISDDAVHFIAARLGKLSAGARRALGAASILGQTFEKEKLRELAGDIDAAIEEAVEQGTLAPPVEPGGAYHFVHEKVREAARSLLAEDDRARLHLELGRAMLAAPDHSNETLFEAAHHVREGARFVDGDEERRSAARLLFEAGRNARAESSFGVARGFFESAASLATEGDLSADPAFAVGLFSEWGSSAHLAGDFERAEALFAEALAHARTPVQRNGIHARRVVFRTARGHYQDAIAAGREGLSDLGFPLPERGTEVTSLPARLHEIARLLGGRGPEDIARAARIEDPLLLARLSLLDALIAPAYIVDKSIYISVIVMLVVICIEHGHADIASFAYVTHALMLVMSLGDRRAARPFFDLALLLEERIDDPALRGKTSWALGAAGAHFLPLRRTIPFFERALEHCVAVGDIPFASYSLHINPSIRLWVGEPLGAVREAWERSWAILPGVREPVATVALTVVGRFVDALTGRTRGATSFEGDDFDDATFVEKILGMKYGEGVHHSLLSQLHYIHGDVDGALAWADRAEPFASAGLWLYFETFCVSVVALALAARLVVAAEDERARLAERLAPHREKIAFWTEIFPENYLHVHLLVSAEVAFAEGRNGDARELYDDAIDAARKNGFVQHEAIASERAAMHYIRRGKQDLAVPYLEAAMGAYARWGATAKVALLEAAHPDVFGRRPTRLVERRSRGSRSLDAAAIVRAAQAIAGEIDLERLLERLLRTVLELAGADRAALVLAREGELLVAATLTVDGAEVGAMRPLAAVEDVAASVVQYVARTRVPVVLGRGASGTPFESDPRFSRDSPRSVLGYALVHREALSGVLYLENRHIEDAFSEDRVELLALLSSQAAIALENALLVADVRRRTEELARTNLELEAELARRTEAESERTAMEHAMFEMQRARIAELSAPLVPITDRVMVIPLVGMMDEARAEDLLRVALEGTSEKGLRALIIDITGVRVVDSHVVGRLLDTVRAVELLGAEVVITGVRADVAQELVRLDIDFGARVRTRSTLQAGIAYALGRERMHR